jgi:HAE1 family hydrophobic/amphiphilic exporter-1
VVDANTEDPDGPNTADMMIRLRNDDKPTTEVLLAGLANFRSQDLIRGLKPILDQISDARIEFRQSQGSLSEMLGTSAAPLVVELAGPELDELTRLAAQVRLRLEQSPSLVNVRTNILEGSPEVLIRLDKGQLSRYGLDVNTVASVLRRRIDGEVATQVRQESGDVDIRVEVDYGTESIDTIRNILFKTSTGSLVRLAAVGEITVERGPREIVRKRQERVAYVYADLVGGLRLSQGIDVARAAIADLAIPARYSVAFTGEEEQRAEAFGDLLFALLLSIALVYMVMASIFESFLQPLLIMLTIPLAGVGVAAALLLGGQTLNVMSIIGIVMLGGIVVNNAIVLLDCVNQVRAQAGKESRHDLSPTDTLVIGCAQRFRPVLMTTATTLLGLLPMAIGLGSGAELRQALALTVLGGLISSTILTLYVIPCTQSVLDSAIGLVRRLYEQARHRAVG